MAANPIGPANPSRIEDLRQEQIQKAAVHRGDAGRAARKLERKEEARETDIGLASQVDSEGRTTRTLEDGTRLTTAPNGMSRAVHPDGSCTTQLPTGYSIREGPQGELKGYDPEGREVAVESREVDGIRNFRFTDARGNEVAVDPEELNFSLRNASKTVTQHVHASGAQYIEAKTVYREPATGRIHNDLQKVYVEPDGQVLQYGEHTGRVQLSQDRLEYTTHGQVDLGFNLPYAIPQPLKGPAAKIPEAASAPQRPASPPDQAKAPPGVLAIDPQTGQELPPEELLQSPASYTGGPEAAPQGLGVLGPGMGAGTATVPPGMADPFPPFQTRSGVVRQPLPDGSALITLPNGVAISQRPDSVALFDARAGRPLPVQVQVQPGPGGTPRVQYHFQDAAGNRYSLDSQSLDFAVESADGRVSQYVGAQGNILVAAQGSHRVHRVEIRPDGTLNTLGEAGVQVYPDRLVFGADSPPSMVGLPSPIGPGTGGAAGLSPGAYPPGPQATGAPPAAPANPQGGPTLMGQPGKPQADIKPGLWQRIKRFFTGDEAGRNHLLHPRPYPSCTYAWAPGMGWTAAMMATTALSTSLMIGSSWLATSMMMYPYGMFYTPFFWW